MGDKNNFISAFNLEICGSNKYIATAKEVTLPGPPLGDLKTTFTGFEGEGKGGPRGNFFI